LHNMHKPALPSTLLGNWGVEGMSCVALGVNLWSIS
jgi:hypothetical protein